MNILTNQQQKELAEQLYKMVISEQPVIEETSQYTTITYKDTVYRIPKSTRRITYSNVIRNS